MNSFLPDDFKVGCLEALSNITEEVRPQQIQMVCDIADCLTQPESVFLGEGGTGIGKSFAYLIPAILSDKKVIITTGKKALQNQLVDKDIPFILGALRIEKKVVNFKGKRNYLCRKKIRSVKDTQIREKLQQVVADKTGYITRDSVNIVGVDLLWKEIDADVCLYKARKKCPYDNVCTPKLEGADIIVTNHSITAIHLSKVPILKDVELLIVDEAHQMPDMLRSIVTTSWPTKTFKNVLKMINSSTDIQTALVYLGYNVATITIELKNLIKHQEHLFNMISEHKSASGSFSINIFMQKEIDDLSEKIKTLYTKFNEITSKTQALAEQSNVSNDSMLQLAASCYVSFMLHTNRISNTLEFLARISEKDETSAFINVFNEHDGLSSIPLYPFEHVENTFTDIPHKILVSATLALNNKFDFSKAQFNLNKTTKEAQYVSPFNINEQSVLFLPLYDFVPVNNAKERVDWAKKLLPDLVKLYKTTQGRSFVLFTSRADMDVFTDVCKDSFPIVVQSDSPHQTLEEYIKYPNAVLFGMKTFWEGIDLPGDLLKAVIIPRLPFPHIYNPVIEGLSRKHGNGAFMKVNIPHMLFDMKQGVGRLLRKSTDVGVLAILDARCWSGVSNLDKHQAAINALKEKDPKQQIPRKYGHLLISAIGYNKVYTPHMDVVFRRYRKMLKNACN
jgi:ATP-dependent DNA helicase DinG